MRVRAPRLSLAVVFLAALLFSGCAGTKELRGPTDPKELYTDGMKKYLDARYDEAEESLKTLLNEHPLSPYALEAELTLGDLLFAAERYDEAASYYTDFATLHPSHPKAPYALFQKGMSYFKEVLGSDRDQTTTRKALFAFEDVLQNYPDSAYSKKSKELAGFLTRRLAENELYVARFYYKGKNYKAALLRLRDVLKSYPGAGVTDEALYYIGDIYIRLGEEDLAMDAFSTLLSDYPESRYAKHAKDKLKGS